MTKLDEDEAAARLKPTSLLDLWNSNKLAITLAGIGAVAAIGGAVKVLADIRGGGDEPPIRVKGGSIDLQLLTGKHEWMVQANTTYCVKTGPQRSKDSLDVVLVAVDILWWIKTSDLQIVHSDNARVDIQSDGKRHLQATMPNHDVSLRNKNRELTYGGSGYINKVQWDSGSWTGGKYDLLELLILDL